MSSFGTDGGPAEVKGRSRKGFPARDLRWRLQEESNLSPLAPVKWTTEVSLATDAQGRVNFVGFYGDYEIICGQQRGEFTLTQGTPNYTVAVSSTLNAVGSLNAFESC